MTGQVLDFLSLPSASEWWKLGWVIAGVFAVIAAGEGARLTLRLSPEFTRKFVHVAVGILIFFAPAIFTAALLPLLLALLFVVVNVVSVRFGLFKSMHGTKRRTYGTAYYPLAFLILILLFWYRAPVLISVSMLVLALADSAAAIVGEAVASPHVYRLSSDKKTIEGSAVFFVISFLIVFLGITQLGIGGSTSPLWGALVAMAVAGTATACEAISSRGLDNLTVPLASAFVLAYHVLPVEGADPARYLLGIGLAALIAGGAYFARVLSASGSVATFLLASVLFGVGGWMWTVPLFTFFVLSSALSVVGKSRKEDLRDMFEKGGTRDYAQVFANGGVAGILVLLSYAFPEMDFYPLFVGSVAAVTADTWGTEIGTLWGGTTYLITTGRRIEPGRNGGISIAGTGAGLIGAGIIGATAMIWKPGWSIVMISVAAGFFGSVIDSVLGATVQAEFRCGTCGKRTEKQSHCGNHTRRERGFGWMRNDAVNWACAAAGAVGAFLLL